MRSTLSTTFRTAFFVSILMSGLAITASAQFRAGIQGVVTDAQGAAIVGATVTLTNKETNKKQETKSGDEGFYRFDRLAPGSYTISAEMANFKKKLLEN